MNTGFPDGVVYTETVVRTPPEKYAAQVPYQIAIVDLPELGRKTVRILGDYVSVGDTVTFDSYREGVACFRRFSDTKILQSSNK